jgi:hypothetical protein
VDLKQIKAKAAPRKAMKTSRYNNSNTIINIITQSLLSAYFGILASSSIPRVQNDPKETNSKGRKLGSSSKSATPVGKSQKLGISLMRCSSGTGLRGDGEGRACGCGRMKVWMGRRTFLGRVALGGRLILIDMSQ